MALVCLWLECQHGTHSAFSNIYSALPVYSALDKLGKGSMERKPRPLSQEAFNIDSEPFPVAVISSVLLI